MGRESVPCFTPRQPPERFPYTQVSIANIQKEVEEMTTILIGIMLISGWYLVRGLLT